MASLERFLASQIGSDFSYRGVGCTLGRVAAPTGFRHHRTQGLVGHGDAGFERACDTVRSWLMFDQPETLVYPPDSPLVPDSHVVVGAAFGPFWATGACRIVDVIDTDDRFGFAYGTLDHVVSGEELFLVTAREDQSVWFSVDAYSRPRGWLSTAGLPFFRTAQRRFRQQAVARIAIAGREARTVS